MELTNGIGIFLSIFMREYKSFSIVIYPAKIIINTEACKKIIQVKINKKNEIRRSAYKDEIRAY